MKRIHKDHRRVPLLFFLFLSSQFIIYPSFAQDESSSKVEEYLQLLRSDNAGERMTAAKKISQSGLSDKRLFDFLNKKLLREFNLNNGSRLHINEMIWYCKAIVASGRSEYKKTLEEVAVSSTNGKLSRHAWQNLDLFEVYAMRNALMNKRQSMEEGLSPDDALYISMIKSDRLRIKREGARKVFDGKSVHPKVFEAINEEILKDLEPLIDDRDHIDTLAWLCKALSHSGVAGHRKTLERVIASASNEKLKEHAKKSLESLPESIPAAN